MVWQVLQERQAGSLHQHAPALRSLEIAQGWRQVVGHVLDSEGGCTNGLHARPPARHLGHQKRRSDWCLFPELQGGFGSKTLRCAKRVGSTALGERTSSCRGPWTMPKSPRLATSPRPVAALARVTG